MLFIYIRYVWLPQNASNSNNAFNVNSDGNVNNNNVNNNQFAVRPDLYKMCNMIH